MPHSDLLNSDLPRARDVETVALLADAARRIALPLFRSPALATFNKREADFDPVTEADRGVEKEMRAILAARHPLDGVFGEEFGRSEGSTGREWILDPIDGTRAFISGLPTWGVLIGLHDQGVPVIGALDQPFTGERFIGVVDGAQRHCSWQRGEAHQALTVRPCEKLADATLMCTTPALFTDPAQRAAYDAVERSVRLVRYGADCYQYAMLAAGQVDLVIEAGLSAYDIQPLVPIIEAAGGIVTDWQGNPRPWDGAVIAACSPSIHAQALALLGQA
ncbi:MAG: histidinol-phosphatase [Neomegalonema sp.]|nr:histidinol-phosphatase [Neomegalonema sp.]